SGVFFSKNAAPELIRPVTNILPLTLLNDALREISVQGATIWDVRTQILGLLIWTLAGFILAVPLFPFAKFGSISLLARDHAQVLVLLLWTLAGFILAVRLFRFEKF